MKILLVLMVCLFAYQVLKAQTWSEWFRQNHTQLLYLQEQIAALQAYNNTQQTGYAISEEGLMQIDSTQEADEAQHAAHFAALRTPSQSVLADPRIREIDTLCERCDLIANTLFFLGGLRNRATGPWPEIGEDAADFIDRSVDRLSEELYDVILAGKTTMNDAQREQTIETLLDKTRTLYKQASHQLQIMTTQPILP